MISSVLSGISGQPREQRLDPGELLDRHPRRIQILRSRLDFEVVDSFPSEILIGDGHFEQWNVYRHLVTRRRSSLSVEPEAKVVVRLERQRVVRLAGDIPQTPDPAGHQLAVAGHPKDDLVTELHQLAAVIIGDGPRFKGVIPVGHPGWEIPSLKVDLQDPRAEIVPGDQLVRHQEIFARRQATACLLF